MQRHVPLWWLILGCVVTLLAGAGVGSVMRSQTPKDASAELAKTNAHLNELQTALKDLMAQTKALRSQTPKDASAEITKANAYLEAGEWQNAYDALLAAMRVAPSDEKIFDASLDFVRRAATKDNAEALLLAEDIQHRAANLIPFLPLERLKEARAAHTQAGDQLLATQAGDQLSATAKGANPKEMLAEAENLLTAAGRIKLPNFVRTHLLQEVEAELGNQAGRVALMTMNPKDEENFWTLWKDVKLRYEEAQKDLLTALYQEDCGPRIQAWSKKVEELNKKPAVAGLDEIPKVNEEISALIVEGQRISRDLIPYLEAGVEAAVKDNQASGPDEKVNRLARVREWNYNRWALDRIDKVEMSGGTALDKLRSLSAIDETRLAPYVGQRFTEVWQKFFNDCSTDAKVEATKFRILQEFRQ